MAFEGVVAALNAAGDDAEALVPAIARAEAAGLDGVPGEDRQRLRAARTRLRKAREAAAAADAAAAAASRSPHAKESYDAAEFGPLAAAYEGLKWRMIQKPGGATVKPDDFYRLYALAMQAERGDNAGERPMWAERGGLDFEGRARWDAWTAVKGLPAGDARLRFVRAFWEFPAAALYSDTRGEVAAALPAGRGAGAAAQA
ncbi:hypothetical protein Rsub_03032 [Raphidocelis subcapitata]|uniref:ACB domain-containing protein n=1 Tax=Raphidocelis subcapitata TaxID=307507 RepID=A0A2V0NSX0_9CHLO|nr:hypothetical protein Rsub_03032 [Raphidocelis subcapitata]|eukprot:GBF90731.1 hypothetical protein Rsub_03032 [Raphidocelis subcapitata]